MEEYPTKQVIFKIHDWYSLKIYKKLKFYKLCKVIGKRDVEAKLLSGTADTAGRSTPDPDMFQQLPINESRQQQSYALISRNKTMDSKSCKKIKLFKYII